MKTKSFLIAAAVLTFGLNAHAVVDLKNANYSDAFLDIAIAGTGYDLRVERAYNSRTLYNGMFGFGWCSEFETSLEITPEGNLKLAECGAGLETVYQAKNFSEKDVEKTVLTIIEKVKADSPSMDSKYIAELKTRLMGESILRNEYATKFGIPRVVADNTKFFANGREADVIEKTSTNYVRNNPDGTIQKFKLNGRLEKMFDRNGNYLSFNYDGKLLRDIVDNNGRKLSITYYDNGKVKTIRGPGEIKAEYKYKNFNDLIFVQAASKKTFTYEYDDLHNMTKTLFSDKTSKEMTYNRNKDWVTSFKDVDGCLEKYDYKLSDDNPKDHFWSTVQKNCKGKTVLSAKYEFWYDFKSDKTMKYLKRSKTIENEQNTEVIFTEFGRPLSISRNGKVTKFDYYDNSLLKKKTTPDGTTTAFYYDNPFKKVSKVVRAGKTSEFQYDNRGNLVKANNSDGQRITLAYDPRGRIAQIEDQAKRKVMIKYDDKFGKPSTIEREGVGSINVTYSSKGEIQKVQSAAGPTVALQVASTFNNLLDLIQPTGVNLSF